MPARFSQLPDKMMAHFSAPHNVGTLENPSAEARSDNAACGDRMHLYLAVSENKITDAKFKTYGCTASIAASSALTTLIIGKTLNEAKSLTRDDVDETLGVLPRVKKHALDLVLDALHSALQKLP